MTVLVTGASGFLGSYLVRQLLADGFHVKALVRKTSDLSLLGEAADQVTLCYGNVLDYFSLLEAMEGVEKVYHSAAVVSFIPSERESMLKTNVDGTANVVNAALEAGIKKLLHVSSIAALGRTPGGGISDETKKWESSKLNSDYAISKFGAEREVWRGIAEGLEAVIVNPSMIIGAGYWDAGTAVFYRRIHNGLKFYTKGATGYVDVRDVASASIALMESPIKEKRFILNAENIPLKDYIFLISDAMGKPRPKMAVGSFLLGFAWRMEAVKAKLSGTKPYLTKQSAKVAGSVSQYSNAAIKEAIAFNFRSVEQSVADIVDVFEQSIAAGKNHGILPL